MTRAQRSWCAAVGAVVAIAGTGPGSARAFPLEDAILSLRTGAEFTRGDFTNGRIDSDLVYLPFALEIEVGAWLGQIEIPVLHQTGPANPQTRQTPQSTDSTIDRMTQPMINGLTQLTSTGLGELSLSLSYFHVPTPVKIPLLAAGVEVKLPTATADDLGSGATDVSLWLDAQRQSGLVIPFARIGYRFLGDNEFVIEDGFFATLGAQISLSESISTGLQYSWNQSTLAGEPDVQEISPYLSVRLSERIGVTPYAIAGLSASSVLGGAGISLTVQL